MQGYITRLGCHYFWESYINLANVLVCDLTLIHLPFWGFRLMNFVCVCVVSGNIIVSSGKFTVWILDWWFGVRSPG